MPKKSGFTLIELLVVITIIAILSAIGLAYYRTFLQNSRDSKRQSDLKLIQTALEDYHSDQLYYPPAATDACPATGDGKLRVGCALTNLTGSKAYLNKIPSDPTANPDYAYVPSNCTGSSCTTYCLYAQVELVTLTSDASCNTLPPGFSAPKAYGVTRP